MKLNKLLMLLACVYGLIVTVSAQKMDKPFDTWNRDQAQKVLTDSSWAKTYQSPQGSAFASAVQAGREQGQNANSGGSSPSSVARNFGPAPVVIRLHSALPVRQALIRLQQIEAGYDKASEDQRAKFNSSAKSFLECPICKNYYVVTITKFPEKLDSGNGGIDEAIFQSMTLNDLKGKVHLVNDKGEKRELVQFTAPTHPGESAVFFFARFDDKKNPLLTSESKELKFVFASDFLDSRNRYAYLVPRYFDFKVSKMMFANTVEF